MRIKYFAFSLLSLIFCLLLLGGIVHNTESSLACPDWPLCYGQVFPKMEGGILIEHSHRLLASLVGFLTILLTVFTFKRSRSDQRYQEVAKLSAWALVMVIVQGLLGGITVIYKLPTIVSTTHLGLSMFYFSTIVLIHHKLSRIETPMVLDDRALVNFKMKWDPFWRHLLLALTVLVYMQILLGAFLRHSGSGASCGLGLSKAFMCFESSTWAYSWWPELVAAQVHMSHRLTAILIALFACFLVGKIGLFFKRNVQGLVLTSFTPAFFAFAAIVLIFIQIALGVSVVTFNISNLPTTAHLGVGALCLVCLWKLNLCLKDIEQRVYEGPTHSFLSDLLDLTKPRLSGLVMVTIFVGMMLAPGDKHFFQALAAFLFMGLVVIGAGALNCYLEREVDKMMVRTRDRSLPSGRLHPQVALVFGLLCVGSGVILLTLFVNFQTSLLALAAAMLYLFAYTPLKQKSELALYVGAIPGAIPPIMGWTAITGQLDAQAWALFLVLFVWQLPHFMAISIYHARDYQLASIKVYPNLKGVGLTKMMIVIFTVVLGITALIPVTLGASHAYRNAALALSGLLLLLSLVGFGVGSRGEKLELWAKNYFWATVLYLPLLLGAMIFLRS